MFPSLGQNSLTMTFAEIDSPRSKKFWRAVFAEFLATFIFVFVCVGCAMVTLGKQDPSAYVTVALCFGFTIFVLIHCVGHISGGHINPAVTIALAATRQLSAVRALAYVVAQCAGSLVASLLLLAALDPYNPGTGHIVIRGANALAGSSQGNAIVRGLITEVCQPPCCAPGAGLVPHSFHLWCRAAAVSC